MMESPVESNSSSPDYLIQLLKDKRQLQVLPACFLHLERLLDEEINRVRGNVLNFGLAVEPMQLPEPIGNVVTLHEKLTIPVKEHPDFNFVGRLLGPRGMTAKQLEMETGCKILIRGRGSMRDKHKEDLMRGKSKWEHLNEDLHVLVSVEDTKNRAAIKLQRAVEEVKKLLVPSPESEDELKKRQLMELALLNGTYRGFQNNNNNNNNLLATNGSGIGVFMMAAPQFCPATGLTSTAVLPPAGLSMVPTSAGAQLAAFPVLMSPEHAGAPIFLATPPPMMSSAPPSLTSPTGLSPPPLISPDLCKMASLPPSNVPTQSHHANGNVFYHHHNHYEHVVGSPTGALSISGQPSQAMFEIPIVSLAGSGNDFCRGATSTAINMVAAPAAAYVH